MYEQPPIEPYRGRPPWAEPLSDTQAISRALVLRKAGMPYRWIAVVMWLYHGDPRATGTWNYLLRSRGAEPRHYKNSIRRQPSGRRQRAVEE